jgi:hypothetical protein
VNREEVDIQQIKEKESSEPSMTTIQIQNHNKYACLHTQKRIHAHKKKTQSTRTNITPQQEARTHNNNKQTIKSTNNATTNTIVQQQIIIQINNKTNNKTRHNSDAKFRTMKTRRLQWRPQGAR